MPCLLIQSMPQQLTGPLVYDSREHVRSEMLSPEERDVTKTCWSNEKTAEELALENQV